MRVSTSIFVLMMLSMARSDTLPMLTYYNGPVISNVEVTAFYYNVSTSFLLNITHYYAFIVKSEWMDTFQQYSTPTQSIGKGKLAGIHMEPKPTKTVWDDFFDVQAYIRDLIIAGKLTPNKNSYYPMHFGPGIQISYGTAVSCTAFAGYHSIMYVGDISQTISYLPYGVIPDCNSADSDNIGDLWSPISHELAETITDPGCGDGWNSVDQGEIGDICSWQDTNVKDTKTGITWEVQKQWSNADQKCAVGAPTQTYTTFATQTPTPTPAPTILNYNGGAVLGNVEITPIFYGPGSSLTSKISSFYSFISSSGFMDVFAEYSTNTTKIGRGSLLNPYTEIGTSINLNPELTVDIVEYLRNLVTTGMLQPNNNSYYPIHLSPNVTFTIYQQPACLFNCAYSFSLDISDIWNTAPTLLFGIVPDQTGCTQGCGPSSNALYNTQMLSAARLAAAITNSDAGWYADGVGGVADLCSGIQYPWYSSDKHEGPYVVNRVWSNRLQRCVGQVPSAVNATATARTTTKSTTKSKTKITSTTITTAARR